MIGRYFMPVPNSRRKEHSDQRTDRVSAFCLFGLSNNLFNHSFFAYRAINCSLMNNLRRRYRVPVSLLPLHLPLSLIRSRKIDFRGGPVYHGRRESDKWSHHYAIQHISVILGAACILGSLAYLIRQHIKRVRKFRRDCYRVCCSQGNPV